ncbi:MAG: type VI secretion system tip protein VgrG [Polyangiaceae bacterium]|nr:type VI secretion system tip protein VgrG [Polyangiaceae bacterium]
MSTQSFEVDLRMGVAQPYDIVSLRVTEGISTPTHAVVEIASVESLDLDAVLAEPATLVLLFDRVEARRFTLRVGQVGFVGEKRGTLRYRVELHAHPWLLRFTNDTRKFRHQSVEQIVGQVLGACGVPFRWETSRPTAKRNYCVQYHETNLAFVSRLLELEGIYYTDDPDGVMVFGDTSAAAPAVPGTTHFELIEAAGALDHDAPGIHSFGRGAKICSGTATVNDFDWKKPRQKLLASRSAERDAYLEIYDYPSGYRDAGEGQRLAALRLEALRAPARYVEGQGTVPGFAPAHWFAFGAAAGAAFADEYLLVSVVHEHDNPSFADAPADADPSTIYRNHFRAIPRSVPFRPALATPEPTIAGYHTAMVRGPAGSEIHTDAYGRFKAAFHWDREATGTDRDSRWLRMLQESASSMFLARVGWEVNVAYIDGDPDRPIGLARNINGVMRPAYALPANQNQMTIRTPSSPATGGYNEIHFDDSAGAMTFDVQAERDLIGAVRHDRSETIGANETHAVGVTLQHDVERDQRLKVGANATTICGGSYQLTVGKNRKRNIGGSEKVDVSKSMNVGVSGDDAEKVGTVRLSIVGSLGAPSPVAMAKNALESAPTPASAAQAVAGGVLAGAKGGLGGGGGMAGAAAGALGGAGSALRGMVPSPQGMLASATGGLSEGVSLGALVGLACQGGIDRHGASRMTRMVGGAHVAAALGTINVSAHYGYAEVVGGAKLTVAATGSIHQSVGGPLALTVGGAILKKATGSMSYSAKATSIRVGGAARYGSAETFRVMCDGTITIEAASELALSSGALELKLTPSETTMKGKLELHSNEKITVTGGKDNVTT